MSFIWRSLQAFLQKRAGIVGINRRNVDFVYRFNERKHYPIANDKLLTKEHLGRARVPTPKTLAVCTGLFEIPSVVASLANEENFVLKPANGGGGAGILVIGERLAPGRWRKAGGGEIDVSEIQQRLADIVFGAFSNDSEDHALIETRITPHAVFKTLWPDGLCDIRVITLHAKPVMAMVRVPTLRSGGRANLHQGGLGLAVDLSSGKTFRALCVHQPVTHHPESNAPLIGLQLPQWEEVLQVARNAAAAVPLGYLGIDVVVDHRLGPLVLEINARPGLEIQNIHGKGLGPTLEAIA